MMTHVPTAARAQPGQNLACRAQCLEQSRNQLQSKVQQLEELPEAPELYGVSRAPLRGDLSTPWCSRHCWGRISRGIQRNATRHGCTPCVGREQGAEGTNALTAQGKPGKARRGRREHRAPRQEGSHPFQPVWKRPGQAVSHAALLPCHAGCHHPVLAQVPADNKVRAPSAGLCLEQASPPPLLCFLSLFHSFIHSETAARPPQSAHSPDGRCASHLGGF